MPRKEKEEDRTERIIRGLLKEPDNRRCINCNSLGPQYVCITFWTYVCTNCSGVHREFSHRVKSVSIAKFKAEEINALQAGGNERARQIYFKSWDPQRNSYPDGSNLYKLREFIKHVYVDRKYAGQNRSDPNLSISKYAPRGDSNEQRVFSTSSFSPRDERFGNKGMNELEPYSVEYRSKEDEGNFRNIFEERRIPRYIPDNVRSSNHIIRPTPFEIVDDRYRDDGRVKHYELHSSSKENGVSQKDRKTNSLPIAIVLSSPRVVPLGITQHPKSDDKKVIDNSTSEQKPIGDPSGKSSVVEKQNQSQNEITSLIDFDFNPEPCITTISTFSSNNIESISDVKKSNYNASINSVESLLDFTPSQSLSPGTSQISNAYQATSTPTDATNISNNSVTIMEDSRTSHMNMMALVVQNMGTNYDQIGAPISVPSEQSPRPEQSKPTRKNEFPLDLFVSNSTSSNPGWPMGYGNELQRPTMAISGFPGPSISSNPFDIGDYGAQVNGTNFSSISSLAEAQPRMLSIASQPHNSPYASTISSPYGMNMLSVPREHVEKQLGSFQNSCDVLSSLPLTRQGNTTNCTPSAPISLFSHGRNPFG